MPWIVSGSCNQCGMCCRDETNGGFMLENPCIVRGQDRCLFFTNEIDPTVGKYGHCLVMQAKRVYSKVRDRFGAKMSAAQIAWFERNCPVWPARAQDIQDLVAGRFTLPAGCGFTLTWVP